MITSEFQRRQERALLALRALLLLVLWALSGAGSGGSLLLGAVLVGVGFALSGVHLAVLALHPVRAYARLVGLFVDAIVVAVFSASWPMDEAMPSLILLPALVFLPLCLVRIAFPINLIHVLMCLFAGVGALGLRGVFNGQAVGLLLGEGVIVIGIALALARLLGSFYHEQASLRNALLQRTRDYRERANLLYELTNTMGESFQVEGILEAALSIGRLGVRTPQPGDTLISMVLLFQTDDGLLHVAASRRLGRADEKQVCAGKHGIIAAALNRAEPVIGDDPAHDVELAYFSAFQVTRSVLCVPLRSDYDNYGVIVYGSDRAGAFQREHLDVLTVVGAQVTMALQNAMLYRSLLDERGRMVEIEEDARKKLARALHDGPTQSVAAIAMRLSIVYKMLGKAPDRVPDEIRKLETMARTTAKEIRHMLFTLRPLVLETQGLMRALEQFAEKMQETHEQNVVVRMNRDVELLLDRNMQGAIFYIAEEAVNNARKHAQASLITVTVALREAKVIIQIADNGRGFNVQAVGQNYSARGSLGMVNMRERAEILDGVFSMESAPGRGTTVTVTLPLRGENASPAPVHLAREGPGQVTKIAVAAVERVSRPR